MYGSNSEEHFCLNGDEQVGSVIILKLLWEGTSVYFGLIFKLLVHFKYGVFLFSGNTLRPINFL